MTSCKWQGEYKAGKIRKASDKQIWIGAFLVVSILVVSVLVLGGCSAMVSAPNAASNGTFQVSPANVSFGNIAIGQKASQSISVANTSKTATTIQQATFSNSQFSLSGMIMPMTLQPGQAGKFAVSVNPAAKGNLKGTLTVQGDPTSSPVILNLTATAITMQPQISLSAQAVNFGTVSVGSTGTSSLSLSNTGATDLTVSVVSVTGAEFGVSGITTPKTISAGQSVAVSLSYRPAAGSGSTGSLSITSNDPTNPTATVALAGTGTTKALGQLSASTSSLNLGNVNTGSHAAQNIILNNTGNATVNISSIQVVGNGFAVSGMTTPATIDATHNATLAVTFTPTISGSSTGTVTVINDASSIPLTITLSGTGVQPGLSVSPASFSFGSVVDGQTKAQNFTITNSGTSTLTISQIGISGVGYSVTGLTTPTSIAAGQSTTFSAQFAPSSAGSLTGSVSITSNASNSPAPVALSGTGLAASVTVSASPASLSFGNVNTGNTSAKSVTLTNNGNASMTLSQIAVNGKDVHVSGITTPTTIAVGKSAILNVTFTPASAESVTGNITVSSTQGANAVIPVSGSGVQAALSVTPTNAAFGNVSLGTAASQTIQLSNTGTAALTVSQLSVAGSGYSTGNVTLPITLNPGQASTFNIQYLPTVAGSATGSVSVVSTAPNSPATIALSGSGVAATQTISLSATNISFGSVTTGTASTHGVTVTNTGNASVKITQIGLSGSAGFSLTGAAVPLTLSATQNLTFNVVFNPSTAGNAAGSVALTSNATGSPSTISLSGTGVQPATHSVTLGWTPSTSTVSGYNVYRSTVSGTGYTKISGGLVGSTAYTDSNVQSGTTYFYVTTAVDSNGNESNNSNEASALVP
jgi:Abnormal spindle-like microcephaly-assoc'd, ASPM-SPD-2-Hydin/Protein of unknown function (DUF1573)